MEKLAIRPGTTSFRGKSKGKENDITQSWKRSFSIGILSFRNSEIGTWKLSFSIFFWGIPVFLCKGIHTNPLGIYVALIGPFNQFALLNFVFLTLCIDSKESCINLVNILLSLPLVLSCR